MSALPTNTTPAELLATATAQQAAGDSAAALTSYERVLPLLTRTERPHDRARVLFQMAQLARFEGRPPVA